MPKTAKRGGARSRKPERPPPPEHPWERQPDETAPAYAAFRAYLDAGEERTLRSVAAKLGKSGSLISRWSSRHRWTARVDSYEAEANKRADDAALDEHAQRARRQAQIAQLHQEALSLPAKEILERLQRDPALLGKLDLDELLRLQASAARALPRAIAAERLVSGQSTSNAGGHDGGKLPASPGAADRAEAEAVAAEKTEDELVAFLAGAAAERQRLEEERARDA